MMNFEYLLPELLLASSILLMMLLFSLFRKRQTALAGMLTFLILILELLSLFHLYDRPPALLFASQYIFDPFACIFKMLSAAIAAFLFLLDRESKGATPEYCILILISLLGAFICASAADMITFAVGIETVFIPLYFVMLDDLTQTHRDIILKYFVFGGIGLGSLLFGFAILYVTTGNTNLYDIHRIMEHASPAPFVFCLSLLFIYAGIAFKIGFVPFHFWYPDAVEQSHTPISGYIAHIPFLAGFPFLIRVLFLICSEPDIMASSMWIPSMMPAWPLLLKISGSITVLAASFAMFNQKSMKRFIAYSSLFHVGFALFGLSTATGFGLKAFLVYIVVFITANLGLFSIAGELDRKKNAGLIEEMRGMGRHSPFYGLAFAVFMLSLSGFPLFSGFTGLFYIFSALIDAKFYWLAGVAIIGNVVAFIASMRLIYVVFSEAMPGASAGGRYSLPGRIVTAVMLIPTIYFGLDWNPLVAWITHSSQILLFPQLLIGGF